MRQRYSSKGVRHIERMTACSSHQVFTGAELDAMEAGACSVDRSARAGCLPPACFHSTHGRAGGLKRTKLFFGARCAPTTVCTICRLRYKEHAKKLLADEEPIPRSTNPSPV